MERQVSDPDKTLLMARTKIVHRPRDARVMTHFVVVVNEIRLLVGDPGSVVDGAQSAQVSVERPHNKHRMNSQMQCIKGENNPQISKGTTHARLRSMPVVDGDADALAQRPERGLGPIDVI